MTEKTPIETQAIKAGDVIRFEWDEGYRDTGFGTPIEFHAIEYRAIKDESDAGYDPEEGTFYLIDRPVRPESPVPTVPTPGVLALKSGIEFIGVWCTHDYSLRDGVGRSVLQHEREIPVAEVVGFRPLSEAALIAHLDELDTIDARQETDS